MKYNLARTNLVDGDVSLSALDEEREVEDVLHGLRTPAGGGDTRMDGGRTGGRGDMT